MVVLIRMKQCTSVLSIFDAARVLSLAYAVVGSIDHLNMKKSRIHDLTTICIVPDSAAQSKVKYSFFQHTFIAKEELLISCFDDHFIGPNETKLSDE